ncbi:MAG: hypothetical protein R3212_13760 [Xanthomonadales bacterium]|nr:hypothetical protein [Xanthomonadales bacterium]
MKLGALYKPILTIAGVIAVAALVYVAWQRPLPQDGRTTHAESGPGVQRPTVSPPAPGASGYTATPARGRARLSESGDASDSDQTPARPRRTPATQADYIPHDVALDQVKAQLWADVQANPPELRPRGDPLVDAELAYRLYMFYGNCTMAPRTAQEIDRRLERMAQRAERAGDRGGQRFLEGMEQRVDGMMDFYELCLAIPAGVDARYEAVQWMTEAVNLGHEIAQVQFYEKAMGFMLRPDRYDELPPLVMQRPGLIDAFKATARYGLSRGMEKGHPEAYLAMSQAVFEGLIYRKDPVMAYAYARAAEMKAMQSQMILDSAGEQKLHIAQHLDPQQVSEGEQLALDLWKESNG